MRETIEKVARLLLAVTIQWVRFQQLAALAALGRAMVSQGRSVSQEGEWELYQGEVYFILKNKGGKRC